MAVDEMLLGLTTPVLRFYGWQQPTLSFGRSKMSLDELNTDYCKEMNLAGVKRQTGGKTVLHHLELTYSFAAASDQFPQSVLETYRLISHSLAMAFARFGLETEMKKERRQIITTSICFNGVSSYELTVGNKKLVGSAQYRRRQRFIQHGSILLDIDWNMWKRVWRLPLDSQLLEQRVTTFQDQLGYIPPLAELIQAIIHSFSRRFQTEVEISPLTNQEKTRAEKLTLGYQWSW